MNEKAFKEMFGKRPLFSTKQVSALMGERYARLYLNRLAKKGSVHRIGRGLYTFCDDPLVYSSYIFQPSYISLLWALQLHGATTQMPRLVQVISPRNGSYLSVELIASRYIWGYRKVLYDGFEIFVADKEKAVLDGIVLERMAMEDIGEALPSCDIRILEDLVLRLDLSDMRRAGYVCSLNGVELEKVENVVCKDRNYVKSIYFQGPNEWKVKG